MSDENTKIKNENIGAIMKLHTKGFTPNGHKKRAYVVYDKNGFAIGFSDDGRIQDGVENAQNIPCIIHLTTFAREINEIRDYVRQTNGLIF